MALTDTVAFATLADLKLDLGITDSASDAALERRIKTASALLERYCNRQFRRNVAQVERLAGYGTTRLLPSLTPITAVATVVFDDGTTIDPSLYAIETDSRGDGWALYCEAGWEWTAPGAQTIDARPVQIVGAERRAFTVTYTGGYSLPNDTAQVAPYLPVEISEACLMLSATLWKQRGRDANVVAESVGDASVQMGYLGGDGAAPGERFGIPHAVAAMVDAYRRPV